MKYIIEFEDEYSMNEGGMKYHQCKQVPYWSVSNGIIKNLTPYTEPDLSPLVDEAVETIENEVWNLARLIVLESDDGGLEHSELYRCFGSHSLKDVMKTHSYQEAKAKYEEWKKEKDKIHVGDIIRLRTGHYINAVVTCIDDDDKASLIYGSGETGYCYAVEPYWEKTGRHFDEIEELLKKMR